MKIFNIILFVCIMGSAFAQESKYKAKKTKPTYEEVKGERNKYVKKVMKNTYGLYNKRNKLLGTDSDYMLRDTHRTAWKSINLNNKKLLDLYMKTYIAPWLKENKNKYKHHESIAVYIFGDMDGNIIELGLRCPKELKIPISAYEEFEQALLSGELKLFTDKENPIFKNSTWVVQTIRYRPETIRNME
ncbi:hypothetical protein [Marinilabilia rubra]|uniref:TonB C-terminal domain-containing protein n=1 Tax=Marinilabilia rubra TaxID=2162893 RepID=A0A2U2B978_9BACT|nr:hypothetical protein [Marinilabilia rubra]PWD99631.1 hypothetical protein DDZ16_09295 [Marinilabilia rubra]